MMLAEMLNARMLIVTRPRVLAPIVLLCSLALGACGQSSYPRPVRSPSATAATGGTPPKTVTAGRLHPAASGGLRPGTPVSSSFTGIRVFVNRRNGFAIPNLPKAGYGTYPVATTNGGKTWRTDGPILHIPAAQSAIGVGQTGVANPRFYFAWCGACNNVIDITPDAGKHWWQAFMPGQVLSLLGTPYSRAGLTAIVEGLTSAPNGRGASLWVYLSTDGRRWTYEGSGQGKAEKSIRTAKGRYLWGTAKLRRKGTLGGSESRKP